MKINQIKQQIEIRVDQLFYNDSDTSEEKEKELVKLYRCLDIINETED